MSGGGSLPPDIASTFSENGDTKVMVNNSQQEVFWEVALAADRKAFLSKREEYSRGGGRPVRLDRSHKSSIIAAAPVVRKSRAEIVLSRGVRH